MPKKVETPSEDELRNSEALLYIAQRKQLEKPFYLQPATYFGAATSLAAIVTSVILIYGFFISSEAADLELQKSKFNHEQSKIELLKKTAEAKTASLKSLADEKSARDAINESMEVMNKATSQIARLSHYIDSAAETLLPLQRSGEFFRARFGRKNNVSFLPQGLEVRELASFTFDIRHSGSGGNQSDRLIRSYQTYEFSKELKDIEKKRLVGFKTNNRNDIADVNLRVVEENDERISVFVSCKPIHREPVYESGKTKDYQAVLVVYGLYLTEEPNE